MKPFKIAHTLSAALALQTTVGAASEVEINTATAATDAVTGFQPIGSVTGTPDLIETSAAIQLSHPDTEFSIRMNPAVQWDEETVKRYRKLAVKEASSPLTKPERKELDFLEELREREENTLTGVQLIEQYRREKTGLEMLRILQTYVRVDYQK